MLRRLPVLLLLLAIPPTHAGSVEAAVGNDAAWFTFDTTVADGKLSIGPTWMHHADHGDVVSFGFHRSGTRHQAPTEVRAGLGGRVFYLDADPVDGYALGLGGFMHYRLPGLGGLGLGGRAHFAPDVVAFGDATRYVEVEVHVSYAVFEGAELSLGYTFAEADFETAAAVDLDAGLLVGFRLAF